MNKPMWRCPDCGRSFANLNQTHTCAALGDLDRHFAKRPPELRALFDALAKAVSECGPAEVLSEKTRIAFHRRMSFLSVYPRKDHLILGFVLAERLKHPRFESVQTFSPRNHVHNLRLRNVHEIDDDVRKWIRDAYEVGEQRHLRR
ncbi:MAG TPA: DUF5655 domain-containing protein [Thermoanaerobaculia bacterium]|jgi:hypothetical protein|nr:DUF5655 domain-containing protein [Thermoanaerobaculia bacterium]